MSAALRPTVSASVTRVVRSILAHGTYFFAFASDKTCERTFEASIIRIQFRGPLPSEEMSLGMMTVSQGTIDE